MDTLHLFARLSIAPTKYSVLRLGSYSSLQYALLGTETTQDVLRAGGAKKVGFLNLVLKNPLSFASNRPPTQEV